MSRYRLIAIVAIAAVAVLLLARALLTSDPGAPTPQATADTAPADDQAASPRAQTTRTPDDERTLPDALPADYSWGVPAPTAGWMAAAAHPIVVDAVLEEARGEETEVTPAGSVIHVGGAAGQFTIYIPPGALAVSEKLTVTPIKSVAGLTFSSGATSAIQIGPEHLAFLKPVAITIEPRRRTPNDAAKPGIAGFAIDGRREWHLYPATTSAETVGRFVQDRHQFAISRAGIFGVAAATEEEMQAAAERLPSNFLSRIEVELARLIRPKAGATAATLPRWRLIPVAYAQSEDAGRRELIARLVAHLRDFYDQQLWPKLQKFRPDCSATSILAARALHQDVLGWIRAVTLLGLTSGEEAGPPDPELERLRETQPVGYQILAVERAADEAYYGPIIKDFDQRQQRLWDAFWDSLKTIYAAIVECCKKKPRHWMPAELIQLQKLAESASRADIIGGGGVGDALECGCAVSAVFHQKGWEGTIVHKYSESGQTTQTRGGRTDTSSQSTTYSVAITLVGADENDAIKAFASAQGAAERASKTVITGGACQVHQAGGETKESGATVTTAFVSLSFYGDEGKYNLTYTPPVAYGLRHEHSWYTAQGCIDPFANRTDDKVSIRSAGVTGSVDSAIQGQTDNQLEVKGSKSVDLPGTRTVQRRRLEVTWDLKACQVQ